MKTINDQLKGLLPELAKRTDDFKADKVTAEMAALAQKLINPGQKEFGKLSFELGVLNHVKKNGSKSGDGLNLTETKKFLESDPMEARRQLHIAVSECIATAEMNRGSKAQAAPQSE